MLRLLGLIACIVVVSANCPPREEMIKCFYEKTDINNDGVVSRRELTKQVFSTLRWYEKIPFKIFGGIGQIMKDCDVNHNGELTVEESVGAKSCMDTCFKRRNTQNKFNC